MGDWTDFVVFCCVQTFTTAETMLNARTVRQWIIASLGAEAVKKHMVAVSTNLKLVQEFGIGESLFIHFGYFGYFGYRTYGQFN